MEPINYRAMNGACGPEFISFSKAQRIESLRLLHTSADSFKVILLLSLNKLFLWDPGYHSLSEEYSFGGSQEAEF